MYIKNENGRTYEVLASVNNYNSSDNLLLLASYEGKSAEEVQAGASATQYIVARCWSEKTKNWDSGFYFWNYEEARENFIEKASNLFYNL